MALEWEWKETVGTATLVEKHPDEEDREFELQLYQGNAFLIMTHEWTGDDGQEKYEVCGFFSDQQHAKNCLGLNKKGGWHRNIYDTPYLKLTKLRINKAKYRYTKDLAALLTEAFDDIQIEIYTEKGGT